MPRSPRLQPLKKTFTANRPSDWKSLNFRRFGGIPNDPNSAAVNDAAMLLSAQTFGRCAIYFPAGTWYFSTSIRSTADGTNWFYGRTFQGEGSTLTTLRLIDGAIGFGSATTPKSFVVTGGVGQTDGSGNQAFANYILDLTIDSGNNPGASALDFFSNNQGAVRNVSVVCTGGNGYSGVEESRGSNGPCFYKNVNVVGFQYGFRVLNDQFSQTYYNCSVSGQSVAGMSINHSTVNIENFNSTNTVPAILITGNRSNLCMFTSDGTSTLSGGDGTQSAIVNTVGGSLYLRNIATNGYAANQTVSLPVGYIPNATITEYFTQVSHNFQSPATSLNLNIKQTPASFTSSNLSDWANIQTYGAIAQNIFTESFDSLPGLNAASASGKPIIHFPGGGHSITGTWVIPSTVKRVVGGSVGLIGTAWNATNGQVPVIQTSGTTTDPLVLDFFTVASVGSGFSTSAYPSSTDTAANQIGIYHNSTRPLVLRSCRFTGGIGIKIAPGAGDVFIEETLCQGLRIGAGCNVWVRELNVEYCRMIVNDGGNLWITGLKTEGAWVNIETKNGGNTELLGAYCYPIESFKETITFTGGSANITSGRGLGQAVAFNTTGSLPAEFVLGTIYFVKTSASGVITLTSTKGGSTAIVPTSSGTGVHTLYYANFSDYLNQSAIVIDSTSNFSGVLTSDGTASQVFPNLFSTTRLGVTRYVKGNSLLGHGNGANCSLFTDYTPTDTTTEQAVIDLQAIATGLGSALTSGDATALDTYIKGLRTDGILAKVPYMFPLMGNGLTTAQYMIDNSRALTDTNAPPIVALMTPTGITAANYGRKTGLQATGNTQWLDAQINVGSNLSVTDIGLHYWTTTIESSGTFSTRAIMGNVNSTLSSYTAIGHAYFGAETGSIGGGLETSTNCPSGFVGNTTGFMSVVNNGSRATQFYLNGLATGAVSSAPPSGTITSGWRLLDVVKTGSSSAYQKPSLRNMLIGLITKGLSSTEMLLLTNRTKTLMQQIGRVPYARYDLAPQSGTTMLGGGFTATPSPYSNQVTTYLRNQAVASGTAMSVSNLTAFDTYISALISNGLMSQVFAFYPWIGENLATALKFVDNRSATPTLSTVATYDTANLTWTKTGGIQGGYVVLINPQSSLNQLSAGLHAWTTQTESTSGYRYLLGGVNSSLTNYTALGTTGVSSRMSGGVGGGQLGSSDTSVYSPDGAGLWSNIANSSKQSQLYLNGSAVGTLGSAATGAAAIDGGTSGVGYGIYAMGLYKAGSTGAQNLSTRNQIFTMLTSYLTSAQMTTLYTITQTYLQSLGRV